MESKQSGSKGSIQFRSTVAMKIDVIWSWEWILERNVNGNQSNNESTMKEAINKAIKSLMFEN